MSVRFSHWCCETDGRFLHKDPHQWWCDRPVWKSPSELWLLPFLSKMPVHRSLLPTMLRSSQDVLSSDSVIWNSHNHFLRLLCLLQMLQTDRLDNWSPHIFHPYYRQPDADIVYQFRTSFLSISPVSIINVAIYCTISFCQNPVFFS